MRVLVACEYSGRVRDAFRLLGHDAMSCDLLPSEAPGPHYQGDVRDILNDGWDLMVAHPDCTYLCSSGLHWNRRVPGRDELTEEALDFVRLLMDAPIPRIAIENPVGRICTAIRKPDQFIQPYQFGHDASKKTGLWLKNLSLSYVQQPSSSLVGYVAGSRYLRTSESTAVRIATVIRNQNLVGRTRQTAVRTTSGRPKIAGKSGPEHIRVGRTRWPCSGAVSACRAEPITRGKKLFATLTPRWKGFCDA